MLTIATSQQFHLSNRNTKWYMNIKICPSINTTKRHLNRISFSFYLFTFCEYVFFTSKLSTVSENELAKLHEVISTDFILLALSLRFMLITHLSNGFPFHFFVYWSLERKKWRLKVQCFASFHHVIVRYILMSTKKLHRPLLAKTLDHTHTFVCLCT